MAPDLMTSDGIHLSQRDKRVFAHKLAGLFGRSLNETWGGEDNIRLACGLIYQG